jgi:hypothetical protein
MWRGFFAANALRRRTPILPLVGRGRCAAGRFANVTAMTLRWRFERGGDWIEISREAAANARQLEIAGANAAQRAIGFATHQELIAFQSGFEDHLVKTGWHYVSFSPDRRNRPRSRWALAWFSERRRRIPRSEPPRS